MIWKYFLVWSWSFNSFICAFWRVYSLDKFNWIVVMTWILLKLMRDVLWPEYGSMWAWIYILLLLSGMFYKCELSQVDWWCCLGLKSLLLLLPTHYINYWERSINISYYNSEFFSKLCWVLLGVLFCFVL